MHMCGVWSLLFSIFVLNSAMERTSRGRTWRRSTTAIVEESVGLSLIPKLKFEHIHLTSFSKMRVDLAAQVGVILIVIIVNK